jgi:hypothetical protein
MLKAVGYFATVSFAEWLKEWKENNEEKGNG